MLHVNYPRTKKKQQNNNYTIYLACNEIASFKNSYIDITNVLTFYAISFQTLRWV